MTELFQAARLVAAMFAILYCLIWALWTFFGPPDHKVIALAALSYITLGIEAWALVERCAVDSDD